MFFITYHSGTRVGMPVGACDGGCGAVGGTVALLVGEFVGTGPAGVVGEGVSA
jgi:hypothetical protein